MGKAIEEKNKTLVLQAFDTLFNHARDVYNNIRPIFYIYEFSSNILYSV